MDHEREGQDVHGTDRAASRPPVPQQQAAPAAALLALQRSAGNAAVSRALASGWSPSEPLVARQPAAAAEQERLPADEDVAAMREDVESIVALLRQQVLTSGEEAQIVAIAERWNDKDWRRLVDENKSDTPHLDKFMFLLKTRTFTRATARSFWHDVTVNAYDTCWHELEGGNLSQWAWIAGRSQKQGTKGPESGPTENVYATIGKHEAMGVWGTLKGMGLVLSGVADGAIWAAWKLTGQPLGAVINMMGGKVDTTSPAITPYLTKSYDEVAAMMGAAMGVDPSKDETAFGQSSYEVGEFGGKIIGMLTTAGAAAGTAGSGIAGAAKALGVVGALKGMEDAGAALDKRLAQLQARTPPPTLAQILTDEAVMLEIANILLNAISAATGAGEAAPSFDAAMKNRLIKYGVDVAGVLPLVGKAWKDYNDPELAKDPEARAAALRDDLAAIVGTLLSTAGTKYDEHVDSKKAAEKKAQNDAFDAKYNSESGKYAAEAQQAVKQAQNDAFDAKYNPKPSTDPNDLPGVSTFDEAHFEQPVDVGERASGSPDTGPTGKSEARTGMHFNEWNAAEMVLGARWDYDPATQSLRSVEFDVPEHTGNEGTRPKRFSQDAAMADTGIAHPTHDDTTGTGMDRGHAAAQQLSGGNPDVAAELMSTMNVWPQEPNVNQRTYKAAEAAYMALKKSDPAAQVRVRVEAVVGSPPRTVTSPKTGATQIVPDAFVLTVTAISPGAAPAVQRTTIVNR